MSNLARVIDCYAHLPDSEPARIVGAALKLELTDLTEMNIARSPRQHVTWFAEILKRAQESEVVSATDADALTRWVAAHRAATA